jgi:hypothetical protein
MSFRMLLYATVAMPFAAGFASAELRLSEPEMDTMTAGLVSPERFALIDCPACAVTTSASTSLNGVTTTSMNGVTTTTTGSTGTAGGGGSGNAGGGGSVLGVFIGSVPVPPGIAATLNQASVVTASHP